MDAYWYTVQLVLGALALAGGGIGYFHFAGKAFDRKYGHAAPRNRAATGE
ncbi:hypothetical protein OPKNFCMD_2400 [Methylobacterium crusticola]|uniref:Uncharacterized protein n=1 Tax=Methylobacterium crusticola TaxID=1697972 RepID=A0ABQ4QWU9_9HYPH|nr:hypothetical protein [Methylobacterium crusticola]GJD49667.1 hypothetical protein OPKNFCMD_2400 [Methylobacterium crusticola]